MEDYFGYLSTSQVNDAKTFARYCQQEVGIPYATQANMVILRRHIKGFFEHYPQADYRTLCKLIDWAKARNKRFTAPHILVTAFRSAWKDGFLPELDPKRQNIDEQLEEKINKALEIETLPFWRMRLFGATGIEARRNVYTDWKDWKRKQFEHV